MQFSSMTFIVIFLAYISMIPEYRCPLYPELEDDLEKMRLEEEDGIYRNPDLLLQDEGGATGGEAEHPIALNTVKLPGERPRIRTPRVVLSTPEIRGESGIYDEINDDTSQESVQKPGIFKRLLSRSVPKKHMSDPSPIKKSTKTRSFKKTNSAPSGGRIDEDENEIDRSLQPLKLADLGQSEESGLDENTIYEEIKDDDLEGASSELNRNDNVLGHKYSELLLDEETKDQIKREYDAMCPDQSSGCFMDFEEFKKLSLNHALRKRARRKISVTQLDY